MSLDHFQRWTDDRSSSAETKTSSSPGETEDLLRKHRDAGGHAAVAVDEGCRLGARAGHLAQRLEVQPHARADAAGQPDEK